MTDTDTELLSRAKEVYKKIKTRKGITKRIPALKEVAYVKQGNFTLVTVNNQTVGVSKCNPTDTYSFSIGFDLALHRAIHSFLGIN